MRAQTTTLKAAALASIILAVLAACTGSALSGGRRARRAPAMRGKAVVPRGIPPALWLRHIPADNPSTAAKVALGEQLFSDKRLSLDGTLSCATCHDPASAFAEHNARAVGLNGRAGARNAPTLLNAMFRPAQFWDGRASSLEEQLTQPLVNPAEMGMPGYDSVVARVAAAAEYRRQFAEVFGAQGVTIGNIARAIAAYERTLLSGNSPFDRFIAGDAAAITAAQRRGWELFRGKAQCVACHTFNPATPFFTDFKSHNTGVATRGQDFARLAADVARLGDAPDRAAALGLLAHSGGPSELGRYAVTRRIEDIGAFQTPTLRDVELTSPYMHDGSEKTLIDVVRFYDRGGERNPYLDERVRPLNLTDAEMSELVEFMRALTSDEVLSATQRARPQTRSPVPVAAAR